MGTYPCLQVDERMWNSGACLEGRKHTLAKLSSLVAEHHVAG